MVYKLSQRELELQAMRLRNIRRKNALPNPWEQPAPNPPAIATATPAVPKKAATTPKRRKKKAAKRGKKR